MPIYLKKAAVIECGVCEQADCIAKKKRNGKEGSQCEKCVDRCAGKRCFLLTPSIAGESECEGIASTLRQGF